VVVLKLSLSKSLNWKILVGFESSCVRTLNGYAPQAINIMALVTSLFSCRLATNYYREGPGFNQNHLPSTGHFGDRGGIGSHHVVHTSPASTWLELISAAFPTFGRATRGFCSSWFSPYSRPSCRKVRAEEEGMATIATKSIRRETKGRIRRDAEG
jgi:hypothetical protein